MTVKEIAEQLLDYYRQMDFKASDALQDMLEDCDNDIDYHAVELVHESLIENHIYEKYQDYILDHHKRFVDNLQLIGFSDIKTE